MQEELTSNLFVAAVMSRWPATIPVFLRHRMGCVGCAMSGFDTVQEVACTYHLDLEPFLDELRAAVQHPIEPSPGSRKSGDDFSRQLFI